MDAVTPQSPDHFIWVDLEMTGLEIATSGIIEIAVVVTDKDLEILGQWPSAGGQAIHQPEVVLMRADPWVTQHLGRLLERVRGSTVDLPRAERAALDLVRRYCPDPGPSRRDGCPLAGNSIGQDRSFLQAYMPEFERYTNYRNVDVSTVKELVQRWFPELQYDKPEVGKHDAMLDIQASIDELRYYRHAVFRS